MRGARLAWAELQHTDFQNADLREVKINDARASNANFSGAKLQQAYLWGTDFHEALFRKADLSGANIQCTHLAGTDFSGAILTGCKVFGTSVWDVNLEDATQHDLIITRGDSSLVTVDNLEVAQFVYLLLNNQELRNVIDTIGGKGVLILGRFTKERKEVLDAIRKRLRELGFVPMMFDFEKPTQRDFTETIKTLAGLSRFIIADITNPRSSPLELQATMPDYMIPFVPIIHESEEPFLMFSDLVQKYGDWVLDVLTYNSVDGLIAVLEKAVVKPALELSGKLLQRKTKAIRKRHVSDYL